MLMMVTVMVHEFSQYPSEETADQFSAFSPPQRGEGAEGG
jgi:hypothetical protein